MTYYVESHMPLVERKWQKHGLTTWHVCTLDPTQSPYRVQAIMHFENVAGFEKAVEEESSEIMDDIKRFSEDIGGCCCKCCGAEVGVVVGLEWLDSGLVLGLKRMKTLRWKDILSIIINQVVLLGYSHIIIRVICLSGEASISPCIPAQKGISQPDIISNLALTPT